MEQQVNWHEYWSRPGTPGFHEEKVNKYLGKYLQRFDLKPDDEIFVPLCGKAVDMAWLAQRGFKVVGVELSEKAVRAFFDESGFDFELEQYASFKLFRSPQVTIYNGNFIHLAALELANCKLVYDRASMVAIEAQNRASYCRHMMAIVPPATPMLVIVLEYEQQAMTGPPFSVPVDEVESYYADNYRLVELESEELIEKEPRWRSRGLGSFRDSALMLLPKIRPTRQPGV
jgi:thiopurine S-methyltransferase